MMPLRDKLFELTDMNFEKLKDKKDDITRPLTMDDFIEALKNVQRSVNQDQLNQFQEWMNEFGST